ncbi:MAG: helix-hairpin-helix domain-containing protein [Bryobacterales bacterium]
MSAPVNLQIAQRFEEVADLIEQQSGNPFRARAYRQAAETLRRTPRSVREIFDAEGEAGLERLEGVGDVLARQIRITLATGRLPMLERLRGESDPEALLASVPGIGRKTAERLHHDLGIDSLEDLEAAAHDGRLDTLAGFGTKKIAGVIDSLQGRLGRLRRRTPPLPEEPPVEDLLSVDEEYLEKAAGGELKKIAPRRFNPNNEAWLPILHTRRSGREFTALFSNTARAHRLDRTRDWVVIYCDHGGGEFQYTAVTSREGPLTGKRVVRGREEECRAYYQTKHASSAAQ